MALDGDVVVKDERARLSTFIESTMFTSWHSRHEKLVSSSSPANTLGTSSCYSRACFGIWTDAHLVGRCRQSV